MNDDQELLRAFAERKSETAFAALVQKHLPVIYAAAFRQTGDAHCAEEISLAAFTLLARKAGSLKLHPALGGWLYTTTGHLAARWRRGEGRRRRREQEAHAMKEAETQSDERTSETLRPMVDALILDLPERDRLAVLLRYFEGQAYTDIGQRLGLTENAARMRVDRALEQLRLQLHRRGIVSTTTALGVALTAQATLVPPAALGASITLGVSTAVAGGGLLFLMNTSILKTGLAVAAVGICAGTVLWQRHENTRLQEEIASLQTPLKPARGLPHSSTPSADASPTPEDFARLKSQVATLKETPATSWQERADILRELMGQYPEFQIPELALATPEDWLDATKLPLISDEDYRRALAHVRTTVMVRFGEGLRKALRAYLNQGSGAFPTDPAQLAPYFPNPVNAEMWQHYKISPASRFPNIGVGGEYVLTVKSPVDPDYDSQVIVGPNGMGSTTVRTLLLQPVLDAFRAANPGKMPGSSDDLLPYTKTNSQRSAIRAALDNK